MHEFNGLPWYAYTCEDALGLRGHWTWNTDSNTRSELRGKIRDSFLRVITARVTRLSLSQIEEIHALVQAAQRLFGHLRDRPENLSDADLANMLEEFSRAI